MTGYKWFGLFGQNVDNLVYWHVRFPQQKKKNLTTMKVILFWKQVRNHNW